MTKPTITHHMPWQEYFDNPALSSTGARTILGQSPFHYYYRDREAEQTKALRVGRTVHMLALEPDAFMDHYRVFRKHTGEGSRKRNEDEKNQAAADGVELLDEDEFAEALLMRDAISSDKRAANLLATAELEVSVEWTDASSLCPCKARLDIVTPRFVADIKTCRSAKGDAFSRSIKDYGYHIQGAWYMDAFRAMYGREPEGFFFICVEKTKPYAVNVLKLDADSLDFGSEECQRARLIHQECVKSGYWPGYGPGIEEVGIPAYAFPADDSPEAEDDL